VELEKRRSEMSRRPKIFSQADANRLLKAAAAVAKAGVTVRVECRPDVIITTIDKPAELNRDDALPSDSPEEIRKLL
jgi:hypothetical protein